MRKTRLFTICFIFAVACLIAMPLSGQASSPEDLLPFEDTTADVGRGFGDHMNRYTWSMSEFNGDIYAGTWSVEFDYLALFEAISEGGLGDGDILGGVDQFTKTSGGEIWKYETDDGTWNQVFDADAEDRGFRSMVVYDDKLFAATANYDSGNNIFYSDDGETWSELTPAEGPMANADNRSIRTMKVYKDRLVVGTENAVDGGELWAYDGTSLGQDWKKVYSVPDQAVGEIAVYDDELYFGTWDFGGIGGGTAYDLYKLNATDDATNVTPVFPGSDGLNNIGVMTMAEFNDQLYLGTVNYRDGFTFLNTGDPMNPDSWNVISMQGMAELGPPGSPSNAYVWSMQVFDGTLYMGTFNSGLYDGIYDPLPIPLDGRAQLWYTKDGENWIPLVDDGFGSQFTYGFRSMAATDDQLFVGTASNFFIPDLSNLDLSLLAPILSRFDVSPEQFSLFLQRLPFNDQELLFASLGSLFHDFDIGTQVYASRKPVPEPTSILLLGSGLIGTVLFRRRRRK